MKTRNAERGNLIYGEITYKSFYELSKYIKEKQTRNSIYLEIGSGYGKGVRIIAEMNGITSYGIEIDPDKHIIAKTTSYSNQRHLCKWVCDDIRNKKDLLKKADFVFCNNYVYTYDLNEWIYKNLKKGCDYYFTKWNDVDDFLSMEQRATRKNYLCWVSWQDAPITLIRITI